MKYIKLFEDVSDVQQRLNYKNLVDWNIVHEMEFLLTKYEDEGYKITYGVDSIWSPNEPDAFMNTPLAILNEIVDKYHVVYWYSVRHSNEDVYVHPYTIVKDIYRILSEKYILKTDFYVGGEYLSFSLVRGD